MTQRRREWTIVKSCQKKCLLYVLETPACFSGYVYLFPIIRNLANCPAATIMTHGHPSSAYVRGPLGRRLPNAVISQQSCEQVWLGSCTDPGDSSHAPKRSPSIDVRASLPPATIRRILHIGRSGSFSLDESGTWVIRRAHNSNLPAHTGTRLPGNGRSGRFCLVV